MNNKADIDFFFWIPVLIIIVFVMMIFLSFLFFNIGENIFGEEEIFITEGKCSDCSVYLEKKEFLNFLSIKINNNENTLDNIKNSLSAFFEIKNNEGKNFIDFFGFEGLSQPYDQLQQSMYARGFDENDWSEFISAQESIQNGILVKNLINNLNLYCSDYFLELPYGIITSDGLKVKNSFRDDLFLDNSQNLEKYYPTIQYPFFYMGESFIIKYRKSKIC